MRRLGKAGLEEAAIEHALGAGLDQGRQQLGGPPGAAAARIVAGIGEDDRVAVGTLGKRNGIGERRQLAGEALAIGPGGHGQIPGETPRLTLGGRVARRHQDGEAVMGRVAEDEIAEDRDVEQPPAGLGEPALAQVDQRAVGRLGGEQRDRGRGSGSRMKAVSGSASPASISRSASAASSPRARWSTCGLVR